MNKICVRCVVPAAIAALTAFGMLTISVSGEGQTRQLTRVIPYVVGMTTKDAIDSLRWTRLQIVQRDSTATEAVAGTVVDQRPKAGTPTVNARAETLFVATSARKANRTGISWPAVLGAIVTGAATPTRPPPSRAGADTRPGAAVSTDVPKEPGGGSVTVPGTRVQDRTIVPNLRQNTPAMVAAALKRSLLNPGNVSRDYSDQVPAGRVFFQEPPATRVVATFTKVDVWYSIGSHPRVDSLLVPSVVGLTLAAAADSLKRSRLQTGHVEYLTRRGAEGKVVHQVPQQGQAAHPNDAVDLTITTPPAQVSVPSVLTLTRQAARQKLESAGLGVGRVTLVVLPRSDTGIVQQTPAPPAMADSGTLVDLVENRLPELRRVVVPDLTGKSIAAADQALRRDSLVLGDVLRPAVNAVDRVIDQQPKPGKTAFMHSAVTVGLGTDSPNQPSPLTRVPAVVTLTVDSARHVLASSGFTQLSIRGVGDTLTSESIVESQIPTAGDFAATTSIVRLVALSPLDPLPVPNLVGMRREAAQTAAEIDNLHMVVVDSRRRLRLHDEVVRQEPKAQSLRRPDSRIDVVVDVPVMPPLAAAFLGFGIVTGAGGATVKKWRDKRLRASRGTLVPIAGTPTLPVIDGDDRKSLIRTSLTVRFGRDSDAPKLEVADGLLVKPEKPDD